MENNSQMVKAKLLRLGNPRFFFGFSVMDSIAGGSSAVLSVVCSLV